MITLSEGKRWFDKPQAHNLHAILKGNIWLEQIEITLILQAKLNEFPKLKSQVSP